MMLDICHIISYTQDMKRHSITKTSNWVVYTSHIVLLLSLLGLMVPEHTKQMMESFLAEDEEGMAVAAPEANAYEFQSAGVFDMLRVSTKFSMK